MADRKIRFDIEANSDSARRAIAELRREYDRAVADLKRQQGDIALFKAAQQDVAKLERQIRALGKAGSDTSGLSAALAAQRAALQQQEAALRASGVNTNALAQAQAGLRVQSEQTTRTFNAQKAALREQEVSLNGSAAAARAARSQMIAYAAAVLSVGAAIKGVNAITSAGTQLQALESSLLFSTGSAEKAADAYAFVRAEAERLGLPLQVLGKQFAQIAAAANGTALEGEQTRKIFTAVASAARVMGLQSFQVERALLAVQQMMSKGTVQAEELRGQLGEQIPGAFNIAARAMGVTTEKLSEMLKKGEVVASEFLPKFAAELQRTVDPAVPAATRTYAAEIERLRNEITLFLQEVGRSGALDAISKQVVIVTEKLREMSDNGELQPAIDQLVDTLSLLAKGLAEVAEFAAKHGQTILTLASAYAVFKAAQIGLGLGQMAADLMKVDKAARGAAGGVSAIGKSLKGIAVIGAGLFAVDLLVEYVSALRQAQKAEESYILARARHRAETDIALIQNEEYAHTAVKTAAEIAAASKTERAAYESALEGATKYYEALQFKAQNKVGAGGTVSQAEFDAIRNARVLYGTALRELRASSEERVKLEQRQADEIKRIKDAETETITLAVEAQVQAVKRAQDKLRDAEKNLADIARRTAAFQQQLAKAAQPQGERSLSDVAGDVGRIRQALAGGDAKGALDQIEQARDGLMDLARSGKEAPLFLQSFARELGQLALQAGEALRAGAAEAAQEEERKLLTLQDLAKQIERLNITADVSAAEQQMKDLHARTQAFYDANPLVVKVVEQRRDNIALGLEQPVKRARGGPIRGPGSGTSDSILARLSNGEYVVRAAAVRKLGVARLNEINRGRLPAFANGGAIAGAVSRLPAPSPASGGSKRALHLTLPGVGTFEMQADGAVADALERKVRMAALQYGRRS